MIKQEIQGFNVDNSAEQNTKALQEAVNKGGTIYINNPGIYDVNNTISIPSDCALVFGKGVYIRRTSSEGYVFVNKGAFTREYDKNISITGLNLICNGHDSMQGELITGLRGQLCFFYARDIVIRDFMCLDLSHYSYCIQVCTFENLLIENVRIEGKKDGIHIDSGSKFTLRHCIFKTFDDPIALNAHDYTTGAPEMGWIQDGVIEDCYDLDQEETTGYFCRLLAGSWLDWYKGMKVQQSDTVVHNNRMYRVNMLPDGKEYISNTAPTHEYGDAQYDGITWAMTQDRNIVHNCGVRNVVFRDIFLKKKRHTAFSLTFDKTVYARGYYPNSTAPLQENISFENIFVQNEIIDLIGIRTPFNAIKVINSVLKDNRINLRNVDTEGIEYPRANILLSGNTFESDKEHTLILAQPGRSANVTIDNSLKINEQYKALIEGDVHIVKKDI